MREPRPDRSLLGVNFKILHEHPYLFYISSPPPPPSGGEGGPNIPFILSKIVACEVLLLHISQMGELLWSFKIRILRIKFRIFRIRINSDIHKIVPLRSTD